MKTAMQELIDWIKDGGANGSTPQMNIVAKATELLHKEKEQIMNAFIDANAKENKFIDPEGYFNKIYHNENR